MPKEAPDPPAGPASMTAQRFFAEMPPGTTAALPQLPAEYQSYTNGINRYKVTPTDIRLHCDSDQCGGVRSFAPSTFPVQFELTDAGATPRFMAYRCRNCNDTSKLFALQLGMASKVVVAYKIGEVPPYGPPTPARLITMVGPERDYFLKGRRAETQNMGIAAFAYYRRVIENQRDRIFDTIIDVAKKLNSDQSMIDDLIAAKGETQFTKCVDRIKHGLPAALFINGHNPLLLLHSALSEGLHAGTDSECLAYASSIRVVLSELAERLAQAVKDDAELTAAVGRLFKPLEKVEGEGGPQPQPNDSATSA